MKLVKRLSRPTDNFLNLRSSIGVRVICIALFGMLLLVCSSVFVSTATTARESPNGTAIIKLTNDNPAEINAKLVGPSMRMVRLPGYSNYTLQVQPGTYYLLTQIIGIRDTIHYSRTDSFDLQAGEANKITALVCCARINYPEYNKRYQSSESEFASVPGWPANIQTESHPQFNALKVIVLIQELYGAPDEYQYRLNAVYAIKPILSRAIAQNILLPLRKDGFRVTYAGITDERTPPAEFAQATLLVTYNEREGKKFFGPRGVEINCRVALYAAGSTNSDPIWEQWVSGTNDSEVKIYLGDSNQSLRNNSLRDFKSKFNELYFDLSGWKTGN